MRQAATDIIKILTAPPSNVAPSLQAGDETRNGLLLLAKLLNRADKIPDKSVTAKTTPAQRVEEIEKIVPPQADKKSIIKKTISTSTPATIKNVNWKANE